MDPQLQKLLDASIAGAPFGRKLGVALDTLEPDRAVLRLPFDPENVTFGDTVHGGAIAALIDMAAVAAGWSGLEEIAGAKGATLGLTTSYLAPARGCDLLAEAVVRRRGRTVCFCDVTVRSATDATEVATAQVTYHLTTPPKA